MKKIPAIAVALLVYANNFSSFAQCTSSITGDTCVTTVLTANFSGSAPATLKWYRDGVLQQIKTKRNPNSIVVAGGGTTDAGKLYEPMDAEVDKYGNIYVLDDGSQRVQKWAPGATEGITVAGGNGKGSGLNQLFTPKGLAVDKNGNVYVSDDVLARVTKWAPGATQGIVVAGGNGEGSASNQLFEPHNISVDNAGNIYIADGANDRIQKWAPGATTGTTVAGGNGRGSAANQLSDPLDVAVDALGNVYIVDYNDRVQKWAPGATTGITVAGGNGTGSAANQFNFTTALSITPDGSIYVRDQNNNRVQKWNPGATAGITVAGGNGYHYSDIHSNEVGVGFGIFADKSGNIYVPELFEYRVNKFVPAAFADMEYTAIAAGSYRVRINNETGCSVMSAPLQVLTVPQKPPHLYGPASVNAGQVALFKVDQVVGNSYAWIVPADAQILSGQGLATVKVKWGAAGGVIAVTASNACGTSNTKHQTVNVNTPAAFAVAGNISIKNRQVSIYPNPAVNSVSVVFNASKNTAYSMRVTDITGKILMNKTGFANPGENRINIAVDHLAPGNYFITLTDNENGVQSFRFIKE